MYIGWREWISLTDFKNFYLKAINSLDNSDVRISKRANLPSSRLRGFEKGKIGPIDNGDFVGGNYATSLNFSTLTS